MMSLTYFIQKDCIQMLLDSLYNHENTEKGKDIFNLWYLEKWYKWAKSHLAGRAFGNLRNLRYMHKGRLGSQIRLVDV